MQVFDCVSPGTLGYDTVGAASTDSAELAIPAGLFRQNMHYRALQIQPFDTLS